MIADSFEIIDAHMHLNSRAGVLVECAARNGVQLMTVNTEVPGFPTIDEQREIADHFAGERLSFVATFSVSGWGEEGWKERVLRTIDDSLQCGAKAVKVWKNIGMSLRDGNGDFVMIDHPSFDFLFESCEKNGIPVLGHLGEPKNCWLPVERMTVKSDREYFASYPEYHMHRHPDHPSYEEQIEARDRRLDKHPELVFIGAHLASLEWSVERQAGWLDRYPKAAMDLAERINHLQYQAAAEYEKVRSFLLKYGDRLIYGTDIIEDGTRPASELAGRAEKLWRHHWRFFASGDEMRSEEFEGSFRGMALPAKVLRKIFRDNAVRWYRQ